MHPDLAAPIVPVAKSRLQAEPKEQLHHTSALRKKHLVKVYHGIPQINDPLQTG